jgi:3-(3-hydroxy-phenyl)propionate hydroxylase
VAGEVFDVVIVGCGPVGASAANLIGQTGLKTLVIDRALAPYDHPRAVHLDHEIMRIFQGAGLAGQVLPILSTPAGSMQFGADRDVIRQFRKIVITDRLGWASDYFFYQPELEAVLRAELLTRSNVSVSLGMSLVGLERIGDLIELTLEDHEGHRSIARAIYVIGCDGGRSEVRRQLRIDLEDLGFDESWVVVDALVDGRISFPELKGVPEGVDLQDVLIMIGDPSRPISIIPGHGRHRRWEFMLLPGETPESASAPEFLQAILAPWTREARFEIKRAAVYRFHGLLANHWRAGNIFLAGDAAHQTPPFFGQGLCHGIRDVANLAWKLRLVKDGIASAELLDSYQTERKPQVRAVIEASIRTGRYFCTLDTQAAKERDASMRQVAVKTKPGYVDIIPPLDNGVVAPGGCSGKGVRFIQPRVSSLYGKVSLLDDVTGGGFVLLTLNEAATISEIAAKTWVRIGGKSFTIRPRGGSIPSLHNGDLIDMSGELESWLHEHISTAVLLRPDAYVFGTACAVTDVDALLFQLFAALHAMPDTRE